MYEMSRLLRPRALGDVRRAGSSMFRARLRTVNLGYHKTLYVPLSRTLKGFIVLFAAWYLITGSAAAPTTTTLAANSAEERAALEAQLQDLEGQIDQYENQIVAYQKQGSSLKNEISSLNGKIAKLNLQIKAVNLTLSQLDYKITDTQDQIVATEASLADKRAFLGELLKQLYESDRASLVTIFLKNPKLSDFFTDVNDLAVLQSGVRTAINDISNLRDQLSDQKEQYALAKADAQTVRSYQLAQKAESDQVKQQKNTLLQVTKGQESRYQSLLTETKKTAAQIRSRIFQLLGGGQMSFEEAYNYAKLAEGGTGVRAALILAVLDRESALGRNVGRCSYQTAMSPSNQGVFLNITRELDLNPDTMMVSCPNSDGVYGGAMGPAQFVPATWMMYRDRVAKVTGHSPASPWSNADAFVATALYLKDAGAANASLVSERQAAAKYYAGGNWRRFLWTYGEAVVSRAQQFEEDIAEIVS